jgi:hypothetical protein
MGGIAFLPTGGSREILKTRSAFLPDHLCDSQYPTKSPCCQSCSPKRHRLKPIPDKKKYQKESFSQKSATPLGLYSITVTLNLYTAALDELGVDAVESLENQFESPRK